MVMPAAVDAMVHVAQPSKVAVVFVPETVNERNILLFAFVPTAVTVTATVFVPVFVNVVAPPANAVKVPIVPDIVNPVDP
jgi:hypothetical protein